MYTIQVLDKIAQVGLLQFSEKKYQLESSTQQPDAILVRSHSLHDAIFKPNLKAVGRAGIGTDNIPVDKLTELGIPVFFTPGANANAVKELVLAGLLMSARHLPSAQEFVNSLQPDQNLKKSVEQNKKLFVGCEIMGKTLGVIGLGHIGVQVANAALALGMQVISFDPWISLDNALALSPGVTRVADLNRLLEQSSFITIHVPLTAQTKQLINQEKIPLLRDDAILLNFARADIVDTSAIAQALRGQQIRAYVTDFPTAELLEIPNAICLPHLGASTVEAEENCATRIVNTLRHFLETGQIRDSVNFPDVALPWRGKPGDNRLIVANQNMPGMIAHIAQVVSNIGGNIIEMINQSREQTAINLIDIAGSISNEALAKIRELPGVLNAYCLRPGG